jgi:uncharacterized repeat protein (TIGR03803 family)
VKIVDGGEEILNPYGRGRALGNGYGTTGFGGVTFLGGTVFALTKSGSTWQETILYKFTGGNDGGAPTGQLIQDSQGNLYGTAGRGGAFGGGVVFEVTP